jgi:DNA-binding SARP family transcriptional activator
MMPEEITPEGRIDVRLFGRPTVVVSEDEIRLSPMQLALVTIVCGSGQVTRSELASILWSGRDPQKVRHRLRQLLLSANAKIGVRWIDAEGDVLRPSGLVRCDVDAVRRGLDGQHMRAAAGCIVQGFAPFGFEKLDGGVEDWRDRAESRWRRALRTRALAKWAESTTDGALDEGRDAAEALYLLDSTDARSVAIVIEARARAGRMGAAEAAYAAFLEGAPARDPEVEAVIERVRQLAESRERDKGSMVVPLIGRELAMREVRSALDRVAAGRFAFVLVAGEAGIGKTRLLEESRREAVLRGFRCLSAKAVEIERIIPLNPLLDALRGLDLGPHLRALGPPWNAVINSALPAGTYDALVDEVPPIQESGL